MNIPSDIEAEKGLVSSVIQDPRIFDELIDICPIDACFVRPHSRLMHLLCDMHATGDPIDIPSVISTVRSQPDLLESLGGPEGIADLFAFVPAPQNWRWYARRVQDRYLCRKISENAQKVAQRASNAASYEEVSEQIQQLLVEATKNAETKADIIRLSDALPNAIQRWEDRATQKRTLDGPSTGIQPLDAQTRGLRGGSLWVIGAETKGGKTSLALQLASACAVEQNQPVGIISLEMPRDEILDRIITQLARVDIERFSGGAAKQSEMERIIAQIPKIKAAPIYMRDESFITPGQLAAAARRMHSQHGIKILVVDYIQLMSATNKSDSREQQVAASSRALKLIAKELNICVIAMSQLNDDGQMRESRAIAHDADVVIIIEHAKEGDRNQSSRLNVKYNRSGPAGPINITFRREHTRFDEN